MIKEGIYFAPDHTITGGQLDRGKEQESNELSVNISIGEQHGEEFRGKIKLEQAIDSEIDLIIKNPDDFNVQVIIKKEGVELLNLEGNLNDPIRNMPKGLRELLLHTITASDKSIRGYRAQIQSMESDEPTTDGYKNIKQLLDLAGDQVGISLSMSVGDHFSLELDEEAQNNIERFINGEVDRTEYMPENKSVGGFSIKERNGVQYIEGLNHGDYVTLRKIEAYGSAVPAGSVISGQLLIDRIEAPGKSIYLGSTRWGATNWTSPPRKIEIVNGKIIIRTHGGAYEIVK